MHFAKADPSEAERDDASLGKIDTTLLLILHGVPHGLMADHIQDRRSLSAELLRHIQNGRGIEPRHNLVAKLAHAITMARFRGADLPKVGSRVYPFTGPSMEG